MKSKFVKRLLTAGLVLALGVGVLHGNVLAAATVNEAKEKTGTDGSIVITVYDQDPDSAGTGGPDTSLSGGKPVDGVGIKALRIGSVVELTSSDNGQVSTQVAFGLDDAVCTLLGLNSATAIASQNGTHYFTPTAVQTALGSAAQSSIETYLNQSANGAASAVTNTNGVATFSNLSYGLYLLAKSSLPADATTDLVPFLVSVPMFVEDGTSSAWQSTVYAYPKVRTAAITITKAAGSPGDDGFVNSGESIPFTITVTIPASHSATGTGSANAFTKFVIMDTNTGKSLHLDTTMVQGTESPLTVQKGSTTFTGISQSGYDGKSDDEKKNYDYCYTYTDSTSDSILTITLTPAGLAKIEAGLSDSQNLTVGYNATVATDGTFQSELQNTAVLTYRREGMAADATAAAAPVKLYTYGIDLTKTLSDAGDSISADTIQFALYSDSSCQTEIPMTTGFSGTGYWRTAASATPAKLYVDAATNQLNLYGLAPGTYYLKEIGTMEGYTLLSEPITIVITASAGQAGSAPVMSATVNGAAAAVSDGVVALTVANTKTAFGFTLPKTGGSGTLLATVIGLGLLCAGVILLVLYRRKKHE